LEKEGFDSPSATYLNR